jgi:hypothetical protein
MRMLERRSLISPDVRELYHTLRLGRDFIAHGKSSPDDEQITEYVRQSIYLVDDLQNALKTLKERKLLWKGPTSISPSKEKAPHYRGLTLFRQGAEVELPELGGRKGFSFKEARVARKCEVKVGATRLVRRSCTDFLGPR